MGIEKERLHFSWISSAEATKFVDVVTEVTKIVETVGTNNKLVKKISA